MKIVYLPLDERPCNALFPALLCEDHPELSLVRAPEDILGQKKLPGDYEKIREFLLSSCKDADALILSVDMLLYGGIVPSRLHFLSEKTLSERLSVIRRIKAENPALRIYAFSLIMRCPAYTSDDEEPDFYGVCGREIFLYGQNEHKHALGILSEEEYRKQKSLLEPICGRYLPEFTERRKKNIRAVLEALGLFAEGTIDFFVIPQDDSAPYGYTAMDQAVVKVELTARKLAVDIYPGADEVGMTLLSRAVTDRKKYLPKLCPIYPDPECKKVIPLYEDRAVALSIEAQIRNAGCVLSCEKDADILLFCNLPKGEMHEAWEPGGESYEARNLPGFISDIREKVNGGKLVAVADIAYANGGDRELGKAIGENPGFLSLAGYAGWNTSSNTLGTVICQSVLRFFFGDTPTHRRFLALRVIEDLSFDSECRQTIYEKHLPPLGYSKFRTDGKNGVCREITEREIRKDMAAFCPEILRQYDIAELWLPWSRMFEIGLRLTEKEGAK